VMHHTKIDRATTLAIGCAAGVRPSGRFVASGCEAASKRPSTRRRPGRAQKCAAAIFPPKDETREWPINAASRGTYWSAEACLPGQTASGCPFAPFLIDSSLLFRTRLRSPRGDRIGLLLRLRQPRRAWRDDLRSPHTFFRKSCHRHLFRAVDPVPGSR